MIQIRVRRTTADFDLQSGTVIIRLISSNSTCLGGYADLARLRHRVCFGWSKISNMHHMRFIRVLSPLHYTTKMLAQRPFVETGRGTREDMGRDREWDGAGQRMGHGVRGDSSLIAFTCVGRGYHIASRPLMIS